MASRTLRLFVFSDGPRALPAGVRDVEGAVWGEALLRTIQRAAAQHWRDAHFWRTAAAHVAAAPLGALVGRDLAQVCLAFRRIEFSSPELCRCCERHVSDHRRGLNTFELAAVSQYVAASQAGSAEAQDFMQQVADEACTDWRQRETVPWPAWRMLVCSAAQAGTPHQQLFKVAAPHLAKNVPSMLARDAVDVCAAYAAFRFKHHVLLSELSRFLPSMGLNDREVLAMQDALKELDFESPPLQRLHELRRFGRG